MRSKEIATSNAASGLSRWRALRRLRGSSLRKCPRKCRTPRMRSRHKKYCVAGKSTQNSRHQQNQNKPLLKKENLLNVNHAQIKIHTGTHRNAAPSIILRSITQSTHHSFYKCIIHPHSSSLSTVCQFTYGTYLCIGCNVPQRIHSISFTSCRSTVWSDAWSWHNRHVNNR